MDSEILIVGAGIFGISTAYHLALRSPNPSSITIVDREPVPSVDAASTDLNKIIRADYSNPLYMKLGLEAIEEWKKSPLFKDADVYHQTGWIMMDEPGSGLAQRIRRNFERMTGSDPLLSMTLQEIRRNWGGVLEKADLTPFESFFFNPLAGWADAARALKIMADEAMRLGVRYQIAEASRLILGEGGVKGVETKSGDAYTAEKILLCTGAWTSQLMASLEAELDLPDSDCVESQVTAAGVCVAHIQLGDDERKLYDQLPVYVYGGQGEVLPPTDSGVLKFTNSLSFTNTKEVSPSRRISVPPAPDHEDIPDMGQTHETIVPQLLREECLDSIRPRLPQIFDGRKIDYFRICWDAITPAQHPLITQHPHRELSNLYLAVGGSFHCWKFLPIIGQYVVNVLDGVSNGGEHDEAWAWKKGREGQGVHDKLVPRKELASYHP